MRRTYQKPMDMSEIRRKWITDLQPWDAGTAMVEGSLSFQHQSISIPYIFFQMLCDFIGFKTCFWRWKSSLARFLRHVGVSKITSGGGHVPFQIKQEQQQGPRNLLGKLRFSNNLSLQKNEAMRMPFYMPFLMILKAILKAFLQQLWFQFLVTGKNL